LITLNRRERDRKKSPNDQLEELLNNDPIIRYREQKKNDLKGTLNPSRLDTPQRSDMTKLSSMKLSPIKVSKTLTGRRKMMREFQIQQKMFEKSYDHSVSKYAKFFQTEKKKAQDRIIEQMMNREPSGGLLERSIDGLPAIFNNSFEQAPTAFRAISNSYHPDDRESTTPIFKSSAFNQSSACGSIQM
jgi:hypothetical protein